MSCELSLYLNDRSELSKETISDFIIKMKESKFISCEGDIKLSFRYFDESSDKWLGDEYRPNSKEECIELINNHYQDQIDIEFPFKNQYGQGENTRISSFISELNDISSFVSNHVDSYYAPDFYMGAGFRNGTFYNEYGAYRQCAFYISGDGFPDDEMIFLEAFDSFASSKSEKYRNLVSILESCFGKKPELHLEALEG
jgi:hypothetical protein